MKLKKSCIKVPGEYWLSKCGIHESDKSHFRNPGWVVPYEES